MSLEAFNAIAQNMRQQFPGLSEAFILQPSKNYLAGLKVAAKRTSKNTVNWTASYYAAERRTMPSSDSQL